MDKLDGASRLQGRSLAVDFIDERLPQHDPAFLNAPSVFDPTSGRYLPVLPDQFSHNIASQSHTTNLASGPQSPSGHDAALNQASQRVEAHSMNFWNDIFSEAKEVLLADSNEPTSLAKSGGGIRNACSWEEVCARLNEAQTSYIEGEGTAGKVKRIRRKFAENLSQPAAHIAKMVPDIDPWTTPVAGAIGLLLKAMDTAAKTREEILTSLSDFDKTFSNIDSFAATFPTDQNVRQASISLVVAIFQAVEHAIVFFTKGVGRKAAAAVLKGSDYQKELLNSFNEVQKRSDHLIQKAQNSHYEGTRAAIQEVLSREDRLLAGQAQAAQHSTEMKNALRSMIEVYERDRELERKQHQEELRRIHEAQKERDAREAKRHQELLTVLVHQFQITSRPVSPLPTTPALPPPLASPNQIAFIPAYPMWTAQTLLQLLGVPDISTSDLQRVKGLGSTLSQSSKRKADQIPQTEPFRQWMGSLRPAKLLVHGSFRGSRSISPLSLLTATLTEAVRPDHLHFVSMVFFCGCHLDPDEDYLSGAKALIQVLISQLLQQQPHMNISPSPGELIPDRVGEGDLQQLCQLLNLLVRRLPGEITLFCLIDGMVYYERDEFINETQYVLAEIIRLVGDPTVQANVKLLITSPWRTDMTSQLFQEDLEILNMEGRPSLELTPNASRVIRRHISHMESDHSSRDGSPELSE